MYNLWSTSMGKMALQMALKMAVKLWLWLCKITIYG
jgi:hypothetical protein